MSDGDLLEALEALLDEFVIEYRQMLSARVLLRTAMEKAEEKGLKEIWLSLLGQQATVRKIINDPVCTRYPLSPVYSVSVIRFYLNHVTEAGVAMDEDLLEAFFNLNNLKPVSDGVMRDVCHKTYPLSQDPENLLTIRMANQLDSVGLTTWEAGFYLAEYMCLHPEIFENRTLLELGSGVGITGIVLAKTVPIKKCVMTDYTEQVIYNLQQNVIINNTTDKIEVQELDWEHPRLLVSNSDNTTEEATEFAPEIIFVADCVYDPDLIDALVKVLRHFLSKTLNNAEGKRYPCAYVASTLRNPSTFKYFIDTLDKSGISHEDVTPTENIHEKAPMGWKYDTSGTIYLTYLYMN